MRAKITVENKVYESCTEAEQSDINGIVLMIRGQCGPRYYRPMVVSLLDEVRTEFDMQGLGKHIEGALIVALDVIERRLQALERGK